MPAWSEVVLCSVMPVLERIPGHLETRRQSLGKVVAALQRAKLPVGTALPWQGLQHVHRIWAPTCFGACLWMRKTRGFHWHVSNIVLGLSLLVIFSQRDWHMSYCSLPCWLRYAAEFSRALCQWADWGLNYPVVKHMWCQFNHRCNCTTMPWAFASRDLRETHQCEIESRFEMDKALSTYGLLQKSWTSVKCLWPKCGF